MTKRTAMYLAEDMTLEEWTGIGEHIRVLADSSAWWLGDWLVFGQRRYPDRYRRVIVDTALDYQTLRNYAWVARCFSPSRRRAALSFQHHAEVAALSDAEQETWLDRASQLGWSRNMLRSELRASRTARELEQSPPAVRVLVKVDAARMDRWQDAASRAQCELVEWMTEILDRAAVTV